MAVTRIRTVGRAKLFRLVVILSLASLLRYITYIGTEWLPHQKGAAMNTTGSHPEFSYDVNPPRIFGTINRSSYSILHPVPNRKVDNLRILGERHSGTTYLTRYLKSCFTDHQVVDVLVRGKHWFQPSPDAIVKAANAVDKEFLAGATDFTRLVPGHMSWWDMAHDPELRGVFSNSFVLYMVRNPYQWIEAMRRKPWHWPNHLKIVPRNQTTIAITRYDPKKQVGKRRALQSVAEDLPIDGTMGDVPPGPVSIQKSYVEYETLSWDQFIRAPLRLVDEDTAAAISAKICAKGFPRGTLSPCQQNRSYVPPLVRHIPRSFLRNLPFAVNDVIYELQPNGEAFDDPLSLRAAKIRNILGLADVWDFGGFAVVRYEDVLGPNDDGAKLNALVEDLEKLLGVSSHCHPHRHVPKKMPYTIPDEFMEWIGQHAEWETEKRIGYNQKSISG